MSDTKNNEDDRPRILIVDDEAPARKLMGRILTGGGHRQPSEAENVGAARAALHEATYDLVITDMQMPGVSGLDLVRHLAVEYPEVATVMVTGRDDRDLAEEALNLGAYGYIIKPIRANELLIGVSNAARRLKLEIENRDHREHLEGIVKLRTADLWQVINTLEGAEKEIRLSREETIQRLALAAEYRDQGTSQHISRMSRYCEILAKASGQDPELIEMVRDAASMHDIGKIGIPDSILMKPGPLTPEERVVIGRHPGMGYRILDGSRSTLLRMAASISLTHHERPDGTGYPRGLTEAEIPVEGRIAAVADVFDALTTNRVYRRAIPLGAAVQMMQGGSGTQFDAELLDCFLSNLDLVMQVKAEFDDQGIAPKAQQAIAV